MNFNPHCRQGTCVGLMHTRAEAPDTLADEEIWFLCDECGAEKHWTNLGDQDAPRLQG